MGKTVVIQRIGDGYGIFLSADHLEGVGWKEGDRIEIRPGNDRIELVGLHEAQGQRPENPGLVLGTVMGNHYIALKELAKI
jgi:hypothetical protein